MTTEETKGHDKNDFEKSRDCSEDFCSGPDCPATLSLNVRPGTRVFLSFSGTYEIVDSSHYTTPAEISRVTSAKKREELNEVKN